jgi:predicted PurR-regulated permease PerM
MWKAAAARKIPLGTILVTVAVVAATYLLARLVYRLRDVLLLIVVAGFIALLLNPLVVALQQRGIRRRGPAVAIVTLLALVVFAGLAVAFGYPLTNGLTHLADNLPGYVKAAEHGRGWVGHLVVKYHVQHWIQTNAPKIASFGKNLAGPALNLGKGAFSLIIALLTIFILTVLLMLEGPVMRRALLGMMEPERAERYSTVAREVNRSVTGFMLGNLLTSLIAGGVVLVTLMFLGVPYPVLWALWVALVDFIPMVGGALAGIPTVLFAAGANGLTAGIITLVVFLIYTQIENHILNPVVMSRTVRVNPLLVLLSILIGASIGSWIGGVFGAFVAALLAIPAAGALQVLVREIWQATGTEQPGRAATAQRQQAKSPAPGDAGSGPLESAEVMLPEGATVAVTAVAEAARSQETEAARRSAGS